MCSTAVLQSPSKWGNESDVRALKRPVVTSRSTLRVVDSGENWAFNRRVGCGVRSQNLDKIEARTWSKRRHKILTAVTILLALLAYKHFSAS